MIGGLGILVTVGFVLVSAVMDGEHLNKKQYIEDHTSRWLLRAMFCLALGFGNWIWIFAAALLFAAMFDQVLNKFRGKRFWYLGTVAKWDLFWKKHIWFYATAKIIMLIVSITMFLI